MSVFHPVQATCFCGNTFRARAAHSVNAVRSPATRTAILKGKFHLSHCPSCGKEVAVETTFFYTDLARGSVFLVKPRGDRYLRKTDSERLQKAADFVPSKFLRGKEKQLRVIYGLDELREKLVAQDAEYDDDFIEQVKIFVLHEHPFLLHKERLQLLLTAVRQDLAEFTAYHHNLPDTYSIRVPKGVIDDLWRKRDKLNAWMDKVRKAAPAAPQEETFWVNFRNWSLRYGALEMLQKLAREISDGGEPALEGADFNRLVRDLRAIEQLPARAKAELRVIFDYARAKGNDRVQKDLFEIRYGVKLEDEWALNSKRDDIVALWQLFKDLPPSNIEGNTELKKVELIGGSDAFYQWEGVIQIGEDLLGTGENFEDTMRHEVGHSFHDLKPKLVDEWLESEFGWRIFPATAAGVDEWVTLMGGWGTLTPVERKQCTNWLITAAGPGSSWTPGASPSVPQGHPWRGTKFGPRIALEKSTAYWYQNYKLWHRANGKAFFVNYWYAKFMAVDEEALKLVKGMDDYAAMSHYEFFAELYALYYDEDDPKRKIIPKDVAQWMDKNVGKRDPASPFVPGAPARKSGPAPKKRKPATGGKSPRRH